VVSAPALVTEDLVKYLLLICAEEPPEQPLESAEEAASFDVLPDDVQPWLAAIERRGTRLYGSRVSQPANASTVRVRDGEVLISDGPYAETKEWMCGFDVLECESIDEAIELAALHPVAQYGRIEVRPFLPGTGRVRLER